MSDLIDRQAAIDALGDMVMNWTDSDYELGQLNQWKADRKAIIDLPSAQPQRRKGRWIRSEESRFRPYMCSSCGALYDVDTVFGDVTWNFCPNCGADMRGEK